MTNPYAAPEVTPELAQEERKRPKMWRSLLLAYGVHHAFAVLGLFVGLAFNPMLWLFLQNPCTIFLALTAVPILDLYLLVAVAESSGPKLMIETGWIGFAGMLSLVVVGVWYSISPRRELLVYLGAISFAVAVWFIFAWRIREQRLGGYHPPEFGHNSASEPRVSPLARLGTSCVDPSPTSHAMG